VALANALGVPICFRSPSATDMLSLASAVRYDTTGPDLAGAAVGSGHGDNRRRITMGFRVFRDSQGTEWRAWDVTPQLTERRGTERRVRIEPVPHADRRRAPDRRVMKGHRPALTAGLDSGWLCFENDAEKRRLSPIPENWTRASAAELERFLAAAKRAPRPSTAAELSEFVRSHH
jgi:hypothetical protein